MIARFWFRGLLGVLLCLPACATWDGHVDFLGYTTRPNTDPNVRTVFVPIFGNDTLYRGVEFDLQKALVRELGWKGRYRVTSRRDCADTELTGKIVNLQKNVPLISPNNGIRVGEYTLTAELTWTDLRTGEVLSRRQRRPGDALPLDLPPPGAALLPGVTLPGAPTAPTPLVQDLPGPGGLAVEPRAPDKVPTGPPLTVQATGTYIPELGQSSTTAKTGICDRLAIQIINMMEIPW